MGHCEEWSDEAILGILPMEEKQYYVYIMTDKRNTVLYTGITNDLKRRVYEHKAKLVEGFAKRYNVNKLVYYEASQGPEGAILREKQIKGGSRAKEIGLVNNTNPNWKDLYDDL
jgi:putative endonuclease